MIQAPDRFHQIDRLMLAAIGAPGRVLELGCGDGRVMQVLADAGHEPVGIDIDISALRRGVARRSPAARIWGDAQRLPFADESFDCVVSGFFSANLMDRDPMLAEAWRVLRPGGTLAYTLLNPLTRVMDLAQRRLRRGRAVDAAGLWRHFHGLGRPAREARRLLRVGFSPGPLMGPAYLPLLRRFGVCVRHAPILRGALTELSWEVLVTGVKEPAAVVRGKESRVL